MATKKSQAYYDAYLNVPSARKAYGIQLFSKFKKKYAGNGKVLKNWEMDEYKGEFVFSADLGDHDDVDYHVNFRLGNAGHPTMTFSQSTNWGSKFDKNGTIEPAWVWNVDGDVKVLADTIKKALKSAEKDITKNDKEITRGENALGEGSTKLMDLMPEDTIAGGRGDGKKESSVDPKELKIGIEVEFEHTNSKEIAKEIAIDHLAEDPKYYSKLVKSGLVDEPKAIQLAKENIK